MPNPAPKTAHLPKGTKRQLEALGVEALEQHEVSKPVRIRVDKETMARVKALTPKEVGEAVKRGLELLSK